MKRYILIDGENTTPGEYSGIEKLNSNDTIVLFSSKFCEGQLNWKLLYQLKELPKKECPKLIHITMSRNGKQNEKNKMDYYMVGHLTNLLMKENRFFNKLKRGFKNNTTEYCLISKDKGFEGYIEQFIHAYSVKAFRFNSFNDLHNHYNKEVNKKAIKSQKTETIKSKKIKIKKFNIKQTLFKNINKAVSKITSKTNNSTTVDSNTMKIEALSNEVKKLTDSINVLNKEIIESKAKFSTAKNLITNKENTNHKIDLSAFIPQENKSNITKSNNTDSCQKENSNLIYLSELILDKENCTVDNENTNSSNAIALKSSDSINTEIKTKKPLKSFAKLNIKTFIENYEDYPKQKKLLRDGEFVKNIFLKHNLYNHYNSKSLDVFIKNCNEGKINIKTVNKVIGATFSLSAIGDFKPALDEVVKYQIKHDIM